ncbi:MAG: thiamine pyrophosphate-dependent enzyme [Terracidiphilus sp.]
MISKEKLIELYSAMVMCRMIGEHAERLARNANLSSSLNAGLGREATIAGIAVDLRPEDTLETTRQAFVSNFVKGMPLNVLLAGAARSSNGNGHAGSACAAAKEHKAAKDGRIAIAYCDAELTDRGQWRKDLNAAGREDLPVIFVRHRVVNGAETLKAKRQPKRAALPEALEFGVPVIYVDSDDVVAVYRVASESIARARQRRGATLIDCIANRAASEERAGAGANDVADPIAIMERHLARNGLFNRGLRKKITEGFGPQLEKATQALGAAIQQ